VFVCLGGFVWFVGWGECGEMGGGGGGGGGFEN